MTSHQLINGLCSADIGYFAWDWRQILAALQDLQEEPPLLKGSLGIPLDDILPWTKYCGARQAFIKAQIAEVHGAEHDFYFFSGMAAAFYGLCRLLDAHELEQQLKHALGPEDDLTTDE